MDTTPYKYWKSAFAGGVVPDVDANWVKRYGVALGLALAAFVMRLTLFGSLDTRLPFGFFYVAVMIAAWYGGLGPGLFVIGMGLVLGGLFFLPRTGVTGAMAEAERTAILMFVLNGTMVSLLMANLHERIKRLRGDQNRSD
jgi:two-component system sensor histidine kinase/response regulator